VFWLLNAKNGWEETDDVSCSGAPTSTTDERHMEQVKSVLECMCSISCTAVATEVRVSPASLDRILTNSLGK